MASSIHTITVDCAEPATLAEFWAAALGWKVESPIDDDDEVLVESPDDRVPPLLFIRVPEGKAVKNRIHLDLNPADQQAEVDRLLALGARRVDIGQGERTWVVLADPEGNEFCVLTPR
jgi:predicted enzyme related to lactoylglutathione lyase